MSSVFDPSPPEEAVAAAAPRQGITGRSHCKVTDLLSVSVLERKVALLQYLFLFILFKTKSHSEKRLFFGRGR